MFSTMWDEKQTFHEARLGSLEIALNSYIKFPLLYNVTEPPKMTSINAFLGMHVFLPQADGIHFPSPIEYGGAMPYQFQTKLLRILTITIFVLLGFSCHTKDLRPDY